MFLALTPELHVGHDDFLANAAQGLLLAKQLFVLGSFGHRCQELNSVTDEL